MRGRLPAVIGTVTALVLAGCSSGSGGTGTPPAETITPTVIADKTAPPTPVVPVTWPLTGLEGDVVERPAVAVKIENTSQARPQTGLEGADVVWEEVVEFGVSRLVAVYHSTLPEEIGPIRSVRPMDDSIASPLRGLFAFSGGQEGILELIERTPLQILSHDAGDDGFYRVSRRAAPHNVYGSLEDFIAQADAGHQASPGEQFTFARRAGGSAAERLGTPASTVGVVLAPGVEPNWTWDAASGRWLRSEKSTPAVSSSGERLAATNVVVIVVESYDSGFDAQEGAPVPDLRLEGNGEGLVATGGSTLPVTWSKAGMDDPLVITGPDGAVATLAPGNTWVELVPLGTGSSTVS